MAKILVVEDNNLMNQNIVEALGNANFSVESASDGLEGLNMGLSSHFDLFILDWNLPSMSGLDLCSRLRAKGIKEPIIFLTAKNQFENKAEGFQSGADDYLTKPFDLRELVLRVKALLRRPPHLQSDILRIGSIQFDPSSGKVLCQGKPVKLQKREQALLEFFMRNPNSYFSTDALIQRVWESDTEISDTTLRACVAKLRKKLEGDDNQFPLESTRGMGYILNIDNNTE